MASKQGNTSTSESVEIWKDRIRNGQRFMIKYAGANDWERFKNYYRHKGWKSGIMPVNTMFSLLRSMIPQVVPRNLKVSITARKPGLEAELNARIVQKLDNWLLKELATKREFKKMASDNFFSGIGIGFFGYDSEFGFSEKNLDQTGQYSLTQFAKSGSKIEFNSTINPGMPWFLRARPDDVVFPFGSTGPESLEWVAMRVFRKLKDVKADKKYSNTKDLTGTHTPVRTMPEGGVIRPAFDATEETLKDDKWVELWQINDARTGKIRVLVMDYDEWLRNEADELQIEGLPIDLITFNEDPDWIYGVADARVIEPQLLELNDIRYQAMRHRRLDVIKGLIRKGALTPDAIQKLTSEQVAALVEVESDQPSLGDVYAPLNPAVSGILQDLMMQGEVARGDIRETVGFSRVAQGDYQGKTHISAEETKKVFQSLNIRLDERREMMLELASKVVRKFNQVIFDRWTSERVAQIVGPDGAQWWLKFTGPQIRDEYDLNVIAEESPIMDSMTKKQMAIEAAQAWAQLNAGQIKQGVPIPDEIQRLLFSQYSETGLDIDKLLAQSQAGAQQLQQQLGGMGGSSGNAISPALLAQLQGAQR